MSSRSSNGTYPHKEESLLRTCWWCAWGPTWNAALFKTFPRPPIPRRSSCILTPGDTALVPAAPWHWAQCGLPLGTVTSEEWDCYTYETHCSSLGRYLAEGAPGCIFKMPHTLTSKWQVHQGLRSWHRRNKFRRQSKLHPSYIDFSTTGLLNMTST